MRRKSTAKECRSGWGELKRNLGSMRGHSMSRSGSRRECSLSWAGTLSGSSRSCVRRVLARVGKARFAPERWPWKDSDLGLEMNSSRPTLRDDDAGFFALEFRGGGELAAQELHEAAGAGAAVGTQQAHAVEKNEEGEDFGILDLRGGGCGTRV